jgi:hypothetical protein
MVVMQVASSLDLQIVRGTVVDAVVRSVEPTAASRLWLHLERAR